MRITGFLDKDQLASKGLAQVVEAEKSCDMHAKALAVVKGKVNRHQVLSHGASHAEYLKAAQLLQSDHQKSTQQLHDLTANLGFQDLQQPINVNDRHSAYLKLYIQAHAMKHSILQCLMRIQDELNPLQDSQSCTGGHHIKKVGTSIFTTHQSPFLCLRAYSYPSASHRECCIDCR